MRVISGKAKGRRLISVPGDSTRPITDRTKEALFGIISGDVAGSVWLELFAGTGSVGIEALSRGAQAVCFVDKNPKAVETIKKNLMMTGVVDRLEGQDSIVLRADAFTFLKGQTTKKFDYIYVAPPQYKEMWKKAVIQLDSKTGWLNADAWIIVQINPIEYEQLELINLHQFDQRRYGSTLLIFYTST
jgi:16S rRNA (guanine(966)-N(2))-methyltransferase RsmD